MLLSKGLVYLTTSLEKLHLTHLSQPTSIGCHLLPLSSLSTIEGTLVLLGWYTAQPYNAMKNINIGTMA